MTNVTVTGEIASIGEIASDWGKVIEDQDVEKGNRGTDLEGRLLLPRERIGLKEVDQGSVEELIPGFGLRKPIIITKDENPQFPGFNSGQRSGLLMRNGSMLKIKGCAVEDALQADRDYTSQRNSGPLGGQLLSGVREEVDLTLFVNDLLRREGFPVAYEPAAIISYGKMFRPKNSRIKKEMGASVMVVQGDTRLVDLSELLTNDPAAAGEAIFMLGSQAGAIKRLTEARFSWHVDNAHVGNFVVFVHGSHVWLYMADVDASRIRTSKFDHANKKRERGNILSSLYMGRYELTGNPTLTGKYPRVSGEYAVACYPVYSSSRGENVDVIVHGSPPPHGDSRGHFQTPNVVHVYLPAEDVQIKTIAGSRYDLRTPFRSGFSSGYKNPDARQPVPLAFFNVAFGLRVGENGKSVSTVNSNL